MDDYDGAKVVDDSLDIVTAEGCCLLAASDLLDAWVLPVPWRVDHWSRSGLGRCRESSATSCLVQRKGCCGRHCRWPFALRGKKECAVGNVVAAPLQGIESAQVGELCWMELLWLASAWGERRCRGKPGACNCCRRCRRWVGDVKKGKAGGGA